MNEIFLNFNCAQMAASAMWIYLSSLKHHCNIVYRGKICDIYVELYINEDENIEIPQGYYYTSKMIAHFDADDKHPAFKCITFKFAY